MTIPREVLDEGRLAALGSYAILDTPEETGFDDVVHLACRLCSVPVALVSFVDRERQWFKARAGFPPCETALDSSVCAHALAHPDELLVIPDLTADPRTSANPLVIGEPFIRFYAGAPLVTSDGDVLGSLCVIDTKPRPGGLMGSQADDLRALARQVMAQLDLRRALAARDKARADEAVAQQGARSGAYRQRAIFDSTTQFAIVVTDRSGVVTDWNSGAERTLGWSAEEMVGQSAARFFTPEDRAIGQVETEMLDALETGRATDERWHLRRDGTRFWASGEMMPLRDAAGVHSGFVKVLRDRTDEHLAGQALEAAEARLRQAQEAGGIGTFELDVATETVTVSAGFCRIYGLPVAPSYPLEALVSRIVPEDVPSLSDEAARADGRAAVAAEYRVGRPDGTVRRIAREWRPMRDAAGRTTRWLGTIRDVTAQREAADALALVEERFRTIVETTNDAFAIIEVRFDADDRPVDYRFLEANPAFERQAGVDLAGKWVTEFAPDLERFWFETYGHVARTGEPATFESYAEAFGRWFDVRAVRVGDPALRQIAVFFSDVTERRAAAERLRASEATARENVERVQLTLEAGAIIGTWFWDIPTDRFTVDEAFALAFDLDPALGREGLALDQVVATVHPDDRAGLAAAIEEAVARGGRYAHQYRTRRLDGSYRWLEANGHVEHAPDGTPLRFPGVLIDVEDRRATEARRDALLALGDRLRDLGTVPDMTMAACEVLGTTLEVQLVGYGDVDPALETISIERDWATGGARSLAGTLRFRDFGSYIEDLTRGETVVIPDCRTDPRTQASAAALEAIGARTLVNAPVFERGVFVGLLYVCDGRPRGWTEEELAFVRDVASRLRLGVARVRAEELQATLNGELAHRLKNTLAVVQSIASQTLRGVPDREPVDALAKRISALGAAHNVLLRRGWSAAPMRSVVETVLEGLGLLARCDLAGPAIDLGPKATMSLSLVLHEMATNAVKYGALSGDTGRVRIGWDVDASGPRPTLTFDWVEAGGPPAREPTRRGFGSRLVRTGLIGMGGVDMDYRPEGFRAHMTAPLDDARKA